MDKSAFESFEIQVASCETLLEPQTKEDCFEKVAPGTSGRTTDCGPGLDQKQPCLHVDLVPSSLPTDPGRATLIHSPNNRYGNHGSDCGLWSSSTTQL